MTGALLEDTEDMSDEEFGELLSEDMPEEMGATPEEYKAAAAAPVSAEVVESPSRFKRALQMVEKFLRSKFS